MKIHTTIRRPELTDEERARRMETIKRTAAQLILAAERKRKDTRK